MIADYQQAARLQERYEGRDLARADFFNDHISHASIAAKAMMELASRLGFDLPADELAAQLQTSLGEDGIPDEEHEAAEEQIIREIGSTPDRWLAAVARVFAAMERAEQRKVIKGSVVPFIRAVMERAA